MAHWKVGDLAKRTGLSVRTLHYYEEIGLLRPSARTESGHRLYTEDDVARLQRITSLRQLGFSLEDARNCLDQPDFALAPVVDLHLAALEEQIALQKQLHHRLKRIQRQLREGQEVSVTQFLDTMENIRMIDKYLTPEQIQALQAHRAQMGDSHQEAFKAMVDQMRKHMQAGDDPASEAVQKLAREHVERAKQAIPDHEGIGEGLQRMIASEPEIRERYGLETQVLSYLQQAMTIAKG